MDYYKRQFHLMTNNKKEDCFYNSQEKYTKQGRDDIIKKRYDMLCMKTGKVTNEKDRERIRNR